MIPSNGNKVINNVSRSNMIRMVSEKFKEILDIMSFDLEDQQIKDTPNRWAKMMINELLSGCYTEEPKMTVFKNTKKYDEIIFLGPIQIKSLCSHHVVPFRGKAYLAYIPGDYVCGISKLSRIVNWFMRRPQIQEELTKQIADYMEDKLKPKGCAVYIEAQHECMIIRGVEESDSWMKTSDMRGGFKKKSSTRKEFFDMVNKS
jgi:GTP cyclohydrolase I